MYGKPAMISGDISVYKSKWKTCMVKEPTHVKQINHVCKIGLSSVHK